MGSTYGADTLKGEMIHILGGMKCDVSRFHYGVQLQTHWLFISSVFQLAFLGLECLCMTGTEESKTKDKEG